MSERDEFSPQPLTPEYVFNAVRRIFPWFLSKPNQDNPDFHEEYLTQELKKSTTNISLHGKKH